MKEIKYITNLYKIEREEFQNLINQVPNWKEILNIRSVQIIELWLAGNSYKEIGNKINLSSSQVGNIIHGKGKYGKHGAYLKLYYNKPEFIAKRIEKKEKIFEQKRLKEEEKKKKKLENIKYTKTGKIRKKRKIETKPRKSYKRRTEEIKYKKIVEIKEGNICPECNEGIIEFFAANLEGDKILTCKNCKRVFYLVIE
jgi:hypothetical protein